MLRRKRSQKRANIWTNWCNVPSPVERSILKQFRTELTETYDLVTKVIWKTVGKLITGQFSIDALSGPVGIYKSTEKVAEYGIYNLMCWAAC